MSGILRSPQFNSVNRPPVTRSMPARSCAEKIVLVRLPRAAAAAPARPGRGRARSRATRRRRDVLWRACDDVPDRVEAIGPAVERDCAARIARRLGRGADLPGRRKAGWRRSRRNALCRSAANQSLCRKATLPTLQPRWRCAARRRAPQAIDPTREFYSVSARSLSAIAMHPLPVPKSSTRAGRSRGMRSSARSTRSSVSGRGMSTAGRDLERAPVKLALAGEIRDRLPSRAALDQRVVRCCAHRPQLHFGVRDEIGGIALERVAQQHTRIERRRCAAAPP